MAQQSPEIDQITDQVILIGRDADYVITKIGPLVDHTDATVANVNSTIDRLVDVVMDNLRIATENLDQLTDHVKQRSWSLVRVRQPKDRKVPQ